MAMFREYVVAPPFKKPEVTEGRPVRDWIASKFVPSNTENARMARARRRAAAWAMKRGDLAKAAEHLKSADILDSQR